MRPTTPPTLKLRGTSSFGPSVPVASTGRAIASTLTGATRTRTGVTAGSARPPEQAMADTTSSEPTHMRFIGVPFLWLEIAQRSRALEVDVPDGELVGGDDAVEFRGRERSSGIHELDRAGDALFVAPAHEFEDAAGRGEPIIGRRDRLVRDLGRVECGPHLQLDALGEILPLGAGPIHVERRRRAARDIAAAVEDVPRDDERRDPIVLRAPECNV